MVSGRYLHQQRRHVEDNLLAFYTAHYIKNKSNRFEREKLRKEGHGIVFKHIPMNVSQEAITKFEHDGTENELFGTFWKWVLFIQFSGHNYQKPKAKEFSPTEKRPKSHVSQLFHLHNQGTLNFYHMLAMTMILIYEKRI